MNKIYKVIWSKVKNQYVVVSELAHSNGKQSRTSRNSIRSRIAALVVCGAIAAFGVFSAVPNSAFAAGVGTMTDSKYIAFVTPDSEYRGQTASKDNVGRHIYLDDHEYISTKVYTPNGDPVYYWVREGYTIKLEEDTRFQGADKSYVVRAYKSASADTGDIVQSYQNDIKESNIYTISGDKLHNTNTGVYAGGSNGYTPVKMSRTKENWWDKEYSYESDPWIQKNGEWKAADWNDFKSVTLNKTTGLYEYNGQVVNPENVYVIQRNDNGTTTNQIGVFVVDNQVYTGAVHGVNNEVLMTAIGKDGNYYTYWASEVYDPTATIGTMTVSAFNKRLSDIEADITTVHKDDIKGIEVKSAEGSSSNGGTIGLEINNDFNEDGSPTGGKYIPGTITIKNTENSGKNGNDVKIQFGSIGEDGKTDVAKFTVDAGSKVEGLKDGTIANPNDTLTGIKINGEEYQLGGGKTYSPGQGIAISDDNKISVDKGDGLEFISSTDGEKLKVNANEDKGITVDGSGVAVNAGEGLAFETQEGEDKGKLKVNVGDGLSIADGKVVNNLEISGAVTNDHKDGGNWTITDNKGTPEDTDDVTFKNTTLSSSVTSGNEVNNGKEDDKKVVYGKDYTISDTDGNTATLSDVASAKTLQNVDTRLISTEGDVETINNTLTGAVMYDKDGDFYDKTSVTLGGSKTYDEKTKQGGTRLTNVAYATGDDGSEAVNVDYLEDTVDSINEASYKGWTVSVNGETNKVAVPSNGNVDFSNNDENIIVGQDGTNLTFDLNDNITLGDESGTRIQLNGNPQKDSMISITNKDSDTVFNVAKDGTVHSDGDIVAKADSNKKYSLSEVGENAVRYNENKSTVALAGTNGTTITNVADGDVSEGSKEAVNGSQLYATNQKVDAGWVATDGTNKIEVNPTDSGTTTLNFAGDNNITVTADTTNKAIQVALNDKVYLGGDHTEDSRNIVLDGERGVIGLGSNIALDGRDGTAVIGGVNITTTAEEGTGKPVSTINGLSNTTWTGTTETPDRAATEGQLQSVATEAAKHTTVSGDENITVKHEEGSQDYQVTLNPDVTLKGDNSSIELNGTKGTMQVNQETTEGTDFTNINGNVVSIGYTNKEGTKNAIVIDGGEGTITGLSNTTWDGSTNDISRAATEGQLKAVSDTVNAGWIATDNSGKEVAVNPDNNKLKFAGDDNITVSATTDENNNNAINVKLNDNITLGNGQSAITLNGSPENSNDPALSVGTDKFVVDQDGSLSVSDKFNVDAETGNIYAANNSGSAIMMNDDSVALNAGGNGIAISDEGILLNTNGINEDIKLVTKGTSVSVDSNGTTFTNTNTNETTNINGGTINVGDKLMVEEDGSIYATNNNGSTVMINDNGVALNSEGNGVVVSGEGITLNTNGSAVTVDRFNGTTFTNTNTGETTNINGGTITTNTVKGLSNTTWDDELAEQVVKSEELQGTAATQGQLQQAVSAVATEAAKQHTTVSGDDNLTVKSSVNENGGTNYQVTLDDDITLGNPKAGNTEGERSFTINTTAPEGYVPDSYKEENSSGAEFIKENGGFMLFATDTQGHGIFGVTAKGSAWAKDFKTYTTDIYGNNTQYSLNDVGDAVAQMSSYYNKENGKSYTVFSRYLNEAEKDNPFATVDENATRDIPLALRDDGAVLIGATIKGDDFTDNGIRINAETETTYDGDGNEVTNNIATITGLENTEWKPPTPVATFAANDINTTSRAATEAQLDDLYSAVAAYDVNVDGTIDYSHIALAGAPYGASRAGNGTPTGGTSITNVAYASGKDGSEAVNVDYLNDAISDAAENGSISTSDQHLVANTETGSNGVYKPNDDGNVNLIVSDEKGNSSTITIGDVASKEDLDNLKDDVGDLDYSKVEGDTIIDGDSVTDAIGKLDNKIENISGTATDADNNTVTGGKINSDGTISLTQKDKDSIKLEGQLTDSGVVQEGTSFDKETGTITITSQDKYSGETSSVKVEGIASTEVVGATNKEDLATAYKDADKDGNATTEYITDSESMVEADVALDHAIQDVAGTSYANDMVLSNRIDSVEKRLGNVEERIDKVGAMAAAIANLRTMGFDPEAPTEIAIGVGQYKSETGIAIGVFHYPNQDFMLSASLSSSGDELMGGIGATWKLGRKSAAERAKDEEARHLEQAEEMKKLAQQEKVKAQAQRHAKLLAERQQASQKNA